MFAEEYSEAPQEIRVREFVCRGSYQAQPTFYY